MGTIIQVLTSIILLIAIAVVICFTSYIREMQKILFSKINDCHFYVTKNGFGDTYLWLGKPEKVNYLHDWYPTAKCMFICNGDKFCLYSLKASDFKNLTWEDEPQEVFIKL